MAESNRATIYYEADVHRALCLRTAAYHRLESDMVNEAVRMKFAEDSDNLRDANWRHDEESICF
jgi:hypothetical protein